MMSKEAVSEILRLSRRVHVQWSVDAELTVFSQQDLEGKIIVDELRQDIITTNSKAEPPQCTSLAWSADGQVCLQPGTLTNPWLGQKAPVDYSQSLNHLKSHDDSPANMRGAVKCFKMNVDPKKCLFIIPVHLSSHCRLYLLATLTT